MRAPPPVEVTSALGPAWRAALSLVVGASVAVPLAGALPYVAARWGSHQPDPFSILLGDSALQGAIAAGVGLMACAAFWLSRKAANASERTLRWDGQEWVLAGDGAGRADQRGDVSLMLDLGPWMLVRFLPHAASASGLGGAAWLPLTLASDRARWASIRTALWNWRGSATRP